MKKLVFISWAQNCSRSDALARLFGGVSRMIYVERLGSRLSTVWLKYLIQCWRTWKVLRQERPTVVMVMVPPIFACIPVYLYCLLFRAVYVTDSHTAAFTMKRWRRLLFLNAWLFRRAATNIVTNQHLAEQVAAWRAPFVVVGDLPISFDHVADYPLNGNFTIAVICSFNPDEPLDAIWDATRELDDVRFLVTGKLKDAPRALLDNGASNVEFTDFLPDEKYAGLLQASHGVLVLTTRDHTMQRGAYEAVALGTPVITSDWPLLRETFGKGALFVNNSSGDIVAAIRKLRESWDDYKQGIQELKKERLEVWRQREEELRAALGERL